MPAHLTDGPLLEFSGFCNCVVQFAINLDAHRLLLVHKMEPLLKPDSSLVKMSQAVRQDTGIIVCTQCNLGQRTCVCTQPDIMAWLLYHDSLLMLSLACIVCSGRAVMTETHVHC